MDYRKVWVGRLPHTTEKPRLFAAVVAMGVEQLRDLWLQPPRRDNAFGDRCAILSFDSEDEAAAAIRALHQTVVEDIGGPLLANYAKARTVPMEPMPMPPPLIKAKPMPKQPKQPSTPPPWRFLRPRSPSPPRSASSVLTTALIMCGNCFVSF